MIERYLSSLLFHKDGYWMNILKRQRKRYGFQREELHWIFVFHGLLLFLSWTAEDSGLPNYPIVAGAFFSLEKAVLARLVITTFPSEFEDPPIFYDFHC